MYVHVYICISLLKILSVFPTFMHIYIYMSNPMQSHATKHIHKMGPF